MNVYLLFIIIANTITLEIHLQSLKNLTIYSNNGTSEFFKFLPTPNDCSMNDIYHEISASNSTYFALIRKNYEEFKPISVETNNENTKANFTYEKGILKIEHFCGLKSQNFKLDENTNDYWTLIKFIFSDNNNEKAFEFIKICNYEPGYLTIPPAIGLIGLAVLVVFISAKSEMKIKIDEIEEINEIKWWHGIAFVIMGSIVLITIFYLYKYIESFFTFVVIIQCFICSYFTLDYFFYEKLKDFDSLKTEYFSIPLSRYILTLPAAIIVFLWYITRDWRLNNTLGVCLVFTIITLFSIKTFKTCWILLLCIFIYDVFWVFFSQFFFKQNVMVVAAVSMNIPIKLEMPLFLTNNPIKACTFLGLGDLVLPGFIIKYCHSFDKLKLNPRKSYFKLSMILYVISVVLAYLVVLVFNHAQPVMFYISPIFSAGISYFSYKRHEFEEFWVGKDLIGNKIAIEEMINGAFSQNREDTRDNTLHFDNINA
jgi:hypothetical protein